MKPLFIACVILFGAVLSSISVNGEKTDTHISLFVSANPPLPVKNLIPNPSFEEGGEGYLGFEKSKFEIVPEAFSGSNAVKTTPHGNIVMHSCNGGLSAPEPGKSYIASAMVKIDERHTSQPFGGGVGGFHRIAWKLEKGGSEKVAYCAFRSSYKGGAIGWRKVVGQPLRAPKEAVHTFMKFIVANGWCNEGGIVDDLFIGEAYTDLAFRAESEYGIYQVTITNDLGKRIYDSGKLEGKPKIFEKTIQVLTPFVYKVRAIDYDGDLKMIKYPQPKSEAIVDEKKDDDKGK